MPRSKLTGRKPDQGKGPSRMLLPRAAKAGGPIGGQKKHCYKTKPIVRTINKLQRTTEKLVPRAPMKRVIWEEGKDYKEPFRSTVDADDMFIEMMEGYLVNLFDEAGSLAVHAKRETINPKDLYLASRIRGDHKSIISTSRLEENFHRKASELDKEKQNMRAGGESAFVSDILRDFGI